MKRARRFVHTPKATPAFVHRVKLAMAEQGLYGEELARRVGISSGYMSRILSFERDPPSEGVIERIAAALNLDPNRLLWDAGKVPVFLRGISYEDLLARTDDLRQRLKQGGT